MATQPETQQQQQRQSRDEQAASREAEQPIRTTSEVPARRASMLERGRLVTPWELMRRMNAELDRLVDAVENQRSGLTASPRANSPAAASDSRGVDELTRADWVPRIEVLQRDDAMVVRAELPGLKPDDVVVNVENGLLSIWGERQQERHEERNGVVRTERAYGTFFRSIPLPDGADEERISATFRDGVLELTVPVVARERGRRVEVKS
jgi:HSP20 family protein